MYASFCTVYASSHKQHTLFCLLLLLNLTSRSSLFPSSFIFYVKKDNNGLYLHISAFFFLHILLHFNLLSPSTLLFVTTSAISISFPIPSIPFFLSFFPFPFILLCLRESSLSSPLLVLSPRFSFSTQCVCLDWETLR